jgi:hypothetical protein
MKGLGAVAVLVVLAATGSASVPVEHRSFFVSRMAPQVQGREPDSDPMWAPRGTSIAFRRQSAVFVVSASGAGRGSARRSRTAPMPSGPRMALGSRLPTPSAELLRASMSFARAARRKGASRATATSTAHSYASKSWARRPTTRSSRRPQAGSSEMRSRCRLGPRGQRSTRSVSARGSAGASPAVA